jgi:phosphoribosylamine---glycine ligase
MRILVVGGGGREHALALKLAQNPTVDKIFATPGNAGIADIAQCEPLDASNIHAIGDFAEAQGIDLIVVGPEAPLVAGIADELTLRGLKVFGPSAKAARIEGSKAFAKDIMTRAGIPTARAERFTQVAPALAALDAFGTPVVVKADGLAAGKGVFVCETRADAEEAIRDCLERALFGSSGATVLIEEYLEGEEVSAFALADGRTVLPLTLAQDHKRLLDGDKGPNTGGMGAYSPVPHLKALDAAVNQVFEPLVRTLRNSGAPYTGVLFAGLMVTRDGPKVLEFNARFGDPEAQAILPRFDGDLAELLLACVEGNLATQESRWSGSSCVCVVVTSRDYPTKGDKGTPILGLDEAAKVPGAVVFHAGTAIVGGRVVTAGGRILGVSALGKDLTRARERAYEAVAKIRFEGMRFRTDIGLKGLRQEGR